LLKALRDGKQQLSVHYDLRANSVAMIGQVRADGAPALCPCQKVQAGKLGPDVGSNHAIVHYIVRGIKGNAAMTKPCHWAAAWRAATPSARQEDLFAACAGSRMHRQRQGVKTLPNYGPDSNSMIFASLFLENQRHAVQAQHKRPCIGPSVGPALPRAARAPGARQSGCVTSSTPYSLRRPFRGRTLRRYDRKRRRSFPRPLAKFGYHLSAAWQKMLRPGGSGV